MLNLINAVFGSALLLFGRRIFWLFVGVIGFAVGVQLATRFWHGSELSTIIIGLVLGFVFALLAVFLQTIAIGVAGFFGGGYILLGLATTLGVDRGVLAWGAFLVGGIIGLILVGFLFDWALITLSSLAGASMIVGAFNLRHVAGGVIIIVLFIIGVALQGAALRREKHPHNKSD
jgi:hypothetical protein